MIRLHQFPPAYGLPNGSPFCMKVENYLRMTGIPYEVVDDFDLAKAPKGKLPYIEDAERVIADSALILDYLKAAYGDPLDAHLTASEKSVSLAFTRLMDEHLYWAAGIQPRFVEPAGWEITRSVFFRGLTGPLRYIVPRVARYKLKHELWSHGVGRHSREEIYAMGSADVTALAAYLGEKPFFHGDRPTTLDAVAYAYIANLIWVPIESPVKQHALAHPNLKAYCRRMKERYYTDGESKAGAGGKLP